MHSVGPLFNFSDMSYKSNSTSWTYYGQDLEISQPLSREIWRIGSPIIVTVGLIGNAMSALVMRRKKMRKSITSMYLTVLAFADSGVLLVALTYHWLRYGYYFDLQTHSMIACKLHKTVLFFCIHFDSWLLVSVTFERFAAVAMPLRTKAHFFRKRARLGLSIIATLLFAINAHFMWDTNLATSPDGVVTCTYEAQYGGYCGTYSSAWSYVDLFISALAPFAFMLVMNSVIICKLYESSRFRREQNTRTSFPSRQGEKAERNQSIRYAKPMAILLLAVTFVFIALTAPICIIILFGKREFCEMPDNPGDLESLYVTWAIGNLVAYSNNSINFLLYCLSGRRFREELKKMIFFCDDNNREFLVEMPADRNHQSPKPSHSSPFNQSL